MGPFPTKKYNTRSSNILESSIERCQLPMRRWDEYGSKGRRVVRAQSCEGEEREVRKENDWTCNECSCFGVVQGDFDGEAIELV
jgi:hypothetical protein